ncbi:MAG: GLUG motif-containing protein, partial [Thermoplasmatota archaeon]
MKYRSISVLVLMALVASSSLMISGSDGESGEKVFHDGIPARSNFHGGNGTIDDPYQISNIQELQNISLNLTEHFILMNDIDAKDTRNWNGGEGFIPVGNSDVPFRGSLDGSGFEISGLWIDLPARSEVGLFVRTSGAWIHHVGIDATGIRGSSTVGVLMGNCYDSKIENCTISGKLTGSSSHCGGIIGYMSGEKGMVVNCSSDVDITMNGATRKQWVGGSIGRLESGITYNCLSKGDISLTAYGNANHIGGFVGQNNGIVEDCSSEVDIEIEGTTSLQCYYIGGMIGLNFGSIEGSSWAGFINMYPSSGALAADRTGGLVGYNLGPVSNCHSGGLIKITGTSHNTGGLTGYSRGPISGSFSSADIDIKASSYAGQTGALTGVIYYTQISDCFSSGSVDITVSSGNCDFTGGLVGEFQRGQVANCYSKSDLSITASGYIHNVGGLIGYCNQGTVDRTYSTGAIEIDLDGGYTQLIGGLVGQNYIGEISNSYTDGAITVTGNGNAYNIGGLVGWNNRGMSYVYSNNPVDISVSPTSTEAVHSVGGLIGYNSQTLEWAYAEGDITCDLSGSVPNNRFYMIGGLIGENIGGFISKVYSRNNISRTAGTGPGIKYKPERVGGLIGYSSGRILHSFSMGTLSINESEGGTDIGGLVGFNDGDISESYVMRSMFYTQAPVHSNLGGLVGNNDGGESPGSISDCYAILDDDPKTTTTEIGALVGNNAGKITACFYDKDVFAYDRAIVRGTGAADHSANTTTQMKKQETFVNSDWDFINSWGIIEDRTYPWLYPLYRAPVIKVEQREYANEDENYLVPYQV